MCNCCCSRRLPALQVLAALGVSASLIISFGLAVVVQVQAELAGVHAELAGPCTRAGRGELQYCLGAGRAHIQAAVGSGRPCGVHLVQLNTPQFMPQYLIPMLVPLPRCALLQVHPWWDAQYLIPMLVRRYWAAHGSSNHLNSNTVL